MTRSSTPLSSIEALFASPADAGPRLNFEWRLIRRSGRPFLLVPAAAGSSARTSLKLYAAQRWPARVGRAVFPMLFHSPAARLCNEVRANISIASPMVQFLASQAGVSPNQLKAPAIKFGGLGEHKMRLVLLLNDQSGQPLKVIKVGLDEAGRRATRREANFLEKMPPGLPGCNRLSGRLETENLSAFATDFFPGASPANDAGLDALFYSWLNPGPPVPVPSLDCWRELKQAAEKDRPTAAAVEALEEAMAGFRIRSTLHHGDFAPWNLRAVNSYEIKSYDWERGVRHGIPAWDWFHFTVQTAILVQRLPVERVAGEVEQLLASPRFQNFAEAAGIQAVARPLLLSYLLNQVYVVKPLEGRQRTAELYDFLSACWHLRPKAGTRLDDLDRRVGAARQLQTAASLLVNVFWEPQLNSQWRPSLKHQFVRHWPIFALCLLWIAGVCIFQAAAGPLRSLMLFYLAPCVFLSWRAGSRLGTMLATVGAIAGSAVNFLEIPGCDRWYVAGWNTSMRFLMLEACVLLVDKIRRYKIELTDLATNTEPAAFRDGWAVIVACALWLAGIACLNYSAPPQMGFLPLYLVPGMVVTLMFQIRWGTLAALIASVCASAIEYQTNQLSSFKLAFEWNLLVRFGVAVTILVCLDRVRQRSILFYSAHRQTRTNDLAPKTTGVAPANPKRIPVRAAAAVVK